MLSPHIGGSTEEAQTAIGQEVSVELVKFINNGTSLGAVNFPEIDLRGMTVDSKGARVLHVHRNVPGVLKVHPFDSYCFVFHVNGEERVIFLFALFHQMIN